MNNEIFLVSYAHDREWAEFCVRSCRKFIHGFSGLTIVVPTQDYNLFRPLERYQTADGAPVRLRQYAEFPGRGMLAHEVVICSADIFCPEADFFTHIDSDCVMTMHTCPEDYMTDGKPDLLKRTFASFHGKEAACWQKPTEAALGIPVAYETMARHPAVHYRWLYKSLRDRIEQVHRCPFHDYVLRCHNVFPYGFAEFPSLGAWALEEFEDKYNWIDVTNRSATDISVKYKDRMRQGWTHHRTDAAGRMEEARQRAEFEKIVA